MILRGSATLVCRTALSKTGLTSFATLWCDDTLMAGILSGLRVIECSTYIAGPAAATILSDFGADVIKIERPPYGDPYRYLGQVAGMPVSDQNYCWILDDRNKRSVALDLNDAESRQALVKLIAAADIFITNYQPQLLRKFKLEYADLAAMNPRLIYASITGYGENGDDAEKPGYDATAYWARSGLMFGMHNGDAEPVQSPAGFGDHPTSVTLFAGVVLALYRRQLTGAGSKVSTSLMANGAWANGCAIQAALCGAEFLPKVDARKRHQPAGEPLRGARRPPHFLLFIRPAARLAASVPRAGASGTYRRSALFNIRSAPRAQRCADRPDGSRHRAPRSGRLGADFQALRFDLGTRAVGGGSRARSTDGFERSFRGDPSRPEDHSESGHGGRLRKASAAHGAENG